MKRKLYCLAISVWNADDFFSGKNTNPISFESYLCPSREDAEKKAKSLYFDNGTYNEGFIYEGELEEEEILDITGYDNIEDFNEALSEPYSTNPKNAVAKEILDSPTNEWDVECANYDFNKSLNGAILVFWRWEKYVGYCRKLIEVRDAYYDETERILTKEDKVYVPQCDVLVTAEERDGLDNDALIGIVEERLNESSWRWNNNVSTFIEEYAESL